ncbi:MAG TPA: addiction module protein [Pyrinomonadaceae bacterium]|nr:addiction module protein [Pyrinomonadaceae bacterium]
MNTRLLEITETVLALPIDERAILADRLFESLDNVPDHAIQDAWTRLAVRRIEDIKTGKAVVVDGNEGLDRVRKALQK